MNPVEYLTDDLSRGVRLRDVPGMLAAAWKAARQAAAQPAAAPAN